MNRSILLIRGGVPLNGTVQISGAKNACLPLMAATLLAPGAHALSNVPMLADVHTLSQILASLGVGVERPGAGLLKIIVNPLQSFVPDMVNCRLMRASIVLLGPMVARYGQCQIAFPGGDDIGSRPIDQHLKALRALGAHIEVSADCIQAKASQLVGARIVFDITTVSGTENALMAAVLARGETVIEGAALEPEIVDLAIALRQMGAQIEGEGTSVIRVQGVSSLKPMTYEVMPDRIEAGTFAAAAAMTGGTIFCENGRLTHLPSVVDVMMKAGVVFKSHLRGFTVQGPAELKPVSFQTHPYPGFATDMQAQLMAMMCVARGESEIHETVYENRMRHAEELRKMGADITIRDQRIAHIRGVTSLNSAQVLATDVRASACLVLAALKAQGQSAISGLWHLDRGYELLETKLSRLGAQIQRVSEEEAAAIKL